jgi:hypothetical protein
MPTLTYSLHRANLNLTAHSSHSSNSLSGLWSVPGQSYHDLSHRLNRGPKVNSMIPAWPFLPHLLMIIASAIAKFSLNH